MSNLPLPVKNQYGFFEIRMESVGGQGANLAGKILSEAAILIAGYNGASFASYGSEKKGTPVKSFVRFCTPDQNVRINSPVEEPHVLVIFHESLIHTQPVTAGVKSDSVVIVNTAKSPEEMRDILKLEGGKVYTLDAIKIAREEKVRINTVLLGTVAKSMEFFFDKKYIEESIKDVFGKKYPKLLAPNLKGFERGYNEAEFKEFKKDGKYEFVPYTTSQPKLGYENAPIGGTIVNPGNTVLKDFSASRVGYIPVWYEDKCTNCGECEVVCPDGCFVWEEGVHPKTGRTVTLLKGIDYQYCKGCGKCVEMCKFGALEMDLEEKYDIKEITVRHPLLKDLG